MIDIRNLVIGNSLSIRSNSKVAPLMNKVSSCRFTSATLANCCSFITTASSLMKAIRSVHQVTPNIIKRLIISHSQVSKNLIVLVVILALPLGIRAQTDNFDSGSLSSAWTKSEFFPQSYTFPSVGSGKGLRIQANPVPSTAPAAAAITQTNNYTDFYVAVDVANWVVEDQALVVLGRWTPGGAAGLAEAAGMICNYDVAQDGDTAGDRNGGEFQINVVTLD